MPPVWPSARPDNFATATPHAATSGTAASETLSFVAQGYLGSGAPPFALLDNVQVSKVPEPAAIGILLSGIAGLGAFAARRRKR